jgi:hypothetical protein
MQSLWGECKFLQKRRKFMSEQVADYSVANGQKLVFLENARKIRLCLPLANTDVYEYKVQVSVVNMNNKKLLKKYTIPIDCQNPVLIIGTENEKWKYTAEVQKREHGLAWEETTVTIRCFYEIE